MCRKVLVLGLNELHKTYHAVLTPIELDVLNHTVAAADTLVDLVYMIEATFSCPQSSNPEISFPSFRLPKSTHLPDAGSPVFAGRCRVRVHSVSPGGPNTR